MWVDEAEAVAAKVTAVSSKVVTTASCPMLEVCCAAASGWKLACCPAAAALPLLEVALSPGKESSSAVSMLAVRGDKATRADHWHCLFSIFFFLVKNNRPPKTTIYKKIMNPKFAEIANGVSLCVLFCVAQQLSLVLLLSPQKS